MSSALASNSRTVYVPSAVSSFFEICDRNPDGSGIKDALKIGSRGGGFVIKRGSLTRASKVKSLRNDSVLINQKNSPEARTTLSVIKLMREAFDLPPVLISHAIEPPIGSGFGTSGSGALGAAIALKDLFGLNLTLAQVSAFSHKAEVESMTGLGTVISLASGSGAIGLVTEPGSFSFGKVDAVMVDPADYLLVCASFGPIEKSSVLRDESARTGVNMHGRTTLRAVLSDPTPANLLKQSRSFAEKTGIATKNLLQLCDKAIELGALGATQNMIGNAIHCLVRKGIGEKFEKSFQKYLPSNSIFVTELIQSGPALL